MLSKHFDASLMDLWPAALDPARFEVTLQQVAFSSFSTTIWVVYLIFNVELHTFDASTSVLHLNVRAIAMQNFRIRKTGLCIVWS